MFNSLRSRKQLRSAACCDQLEQVRQFDNNVRRNVAHNYFIRYNHRVYRIYS